jgi:hypothetical protein
MSITYLSGGRVLDQQFGAVAPTVPATYYFALSTTTPTDAGANFTEPTTVGTAYARVAVDNNKVTWDSAASNALTNLIAVTFPLSTLAWGTITYVGIYDSVTVGAGNLLYFGVLSPSRVIQAGTVVYFAIGDITASITNA